MVDKFPQRIELDVMTEDIDDADAASKTRGFLFTTGCPLARAARRHFPDAWVGSRYIYTHHPLSRERRVYPLTARALAFRALFDAGGTCRATRFVLAIEAEP